MHLFYCIQASFSSSILSLIFVVSSIEKNPTSKSPLSASYIVAELINKE